MIQWTPFQALPVLEVGLWHGGELVTTFERRADRARRPIDIDACVINAVAAVHREVPPAPKPPPTGLGLNIAALTAFNDPMGRENREEAIERLDTELAEYEPALREWLTGYADRCWASYSMVSAPVAIRNAGDNRADDITLRITLADNVLALTEEGMDALTMLPPPKRPRYERRSRYGPGLTDIPGMMPRIPSLNPTARPRSAVSGPTYVVEHDRAVAEVRLDALTHGVTERSPGRLMLTPQKPGVYELGWQAHVGNLRRPARGTIHLDVGQLDVEGEPLTTIEDVVDSGDVNVRDT
jgi:hypothetical protein